MNIVTKVKLKESAFRHIESASKKALVKTADALLTDVKTAQVMPFDTGNLQEDSTFIDDSEIANMRVSIVSTTAYARRLYYHPEYNYRTTNNARAGGKWFDDWVNGDKKKEVQDNFAKLLRREI